MGIFEQLRAVGMDISPPPDTRTVYKYALPDDLDDGQVTIELPVGAEFLAADVQFDGPRAWFSVRPEAEGEQRVFAWVKTGRAYPTTWRYLHTITLMAVTQSGPRPLVCHLFEVL